MGLPPEILSIVMEYLRYDATALRSALLVNKTWAFEAIRVLWETPRVRDLAAIGEDRRQFYADQVRDLVFRGEEDGAKHSTFRNLRFPRLKFILIGSFRPKYGEKLWLGQYIQSIMKQFIFCGAEPAEDILHLLETRCPRPQDISIGSNFEGLTCDRLMNLFESCKSLTSIWLPNEMEDIIDNRLLACLARHDSLQFLKLGTFLTHEMLKNVFEDIERPFRNTMTLVAGGDSEAVSLLVTGIKSVLHLTLTIGDSRSNPLPQISSLVNLRELSVEYLEQGAWAGTEFLALKNLKNLRILHITSISDSTTSRALTDEDFIPIFENMSELQDLVFDVQCVLSTAAIISLGKNCPQLRICEMIGSYDLHFWQSIARPLFPQLSYLSLNALIDGEQESPSSLPAKAATVAGLIVQHAPKLKELHLIDGDEFSKEVIAAFEEHIEKGYNS